MSDAKDAVPDLEEQEVAPVLDDTKNAALKTRRTLLLVLILLIAVVVATVAPIVIISSGGNNKETQKGIGDESQTEIRDPPSTPSPTPPPPWRVPSVIQELDSNMISLCTLAAEISASLGRTSDTESLFPDGLVFVDEPDKAIVVKRNNTCFAAFRETMPSILDWMQNLDPRFENVCSPLACCNARKGYRDAYVEASFRFELEDAVRQCVEDCPNCEVVLTGSSQGGAIAQIASVFLEDLHPAVITFGQPPTMKGPCDALDTGRMYRFINTIVGNNGRLGYDPVPFLYNNDSGDLEQMGHVIVLGEDLSHVAYFGPEEEEEESYYIPSGDWALSNILNVHGARIYHERFLRLQSSGLFPIGIGGWDLNFKCTMGRECIAPHFCGNGQCTTGNTGDP